MSKNLTKIASILNIVVYSLLVFSFGIALFSSLILLFEGSSGESFGDAFAYAFGYVLSIVIAPFFVITILQLIFSCKILRSLKKSEVEFYNKFGLITAVVILSFIIFGFFVFSFFGSMDLLTTIIMVGLMSIILISNILYLKEMKSNRKYVKIQKANGVSLSDKPDDYDPLSSEPKQLLSDFSQEISREINVDMTQVKAARNQETMQNQTQFDRFEDQLNRLVKLKEQGVLSEVEFNELKARLMEKSTKF